MSTTATFGFAFTEEVLKVAVAGTAGTRVDLRVGLDVEVDLVIGRGSEPIRDALESLGAAMEVCGLGGGRETVGGCVPSPVVLLSGRMV